MTVQNSERSYLGIAKEATKGTAVAPTDFFPVAIGKLKPEDHIESLFDTGTRGSMVESYGRQAGVGHSTFDFGGAVFADAIGYVLGGILGEVDTTGASAPYTHVISLKNSGVAAADAQPGAFTITDFYAAAVKKYAGCQIHELTLNFNSDGLLEYDAKATGWLSESASTPAPTFSSVIPTPVWQGTVSIGGGLIANAISGSLTLSRAVKVVYGIGDTQNPYAVFLGALKVSGKFTFVMEDNTEMVRYLTDTQPAIVLDWSNGAGASATQIAMTMTKGAYTAATIERGNEQVEISVTVDAQANVTDATGATGYSPIQATLQNAKVSGTYQ